MNGFRLHQLNESSLLVEITSGSLLEANAVICNLFVFLSNKASSMLLNVVPAYCSLLIVCKDRSSIGDVRNLIRTYQPETGNVLGLSLGEKVIIPVCYDPKLGNDLSIMSEMHKISEDETINLHLSIDYQVFMLGFLPGFPYMGEVNERIATPRKTKPQPIKAGAVGIAGRQTGIYPFYSPGGWHIVGYTPVKMFDAQQETPALLQPGNLVQFESISLEEYMDLNENKTR